MGDAGEGLIDADSKIQERMEELERERRQKDLELQTDRDKLLSASKFNIKNWPDREHVTLWGPDVYSHYGVTYDAGVARGATGTTIESTTGSDRSSPSASTV